MSEVTDQVVNVFAGFRESGILILLEHCPAKNDFKNQFFAPEPSQRGWVDVIRYNTGILHAEDRFSARGERLVEFCLGSNLHSPIKACSQDIRYSKPNPISGTLLLSHDNGVLTLQCTHDDENIGPVDDQKRIVEALLRMGVEIPDGLRCWLIRGDAAGDGMDPAQGLHIGMCRKPTARHITLVPGANRNRYIGPALAEQMELLRQDWCPWEQKSDTAWWGGSATGSAGSDALEPFSRYRFLRHFTDNPTKRVHVHPVGYPQWQDDRVMPAKGIFEKSEAFRHKCLVLIRGNDVASGLSWFFCGNSVVLMRPPVVDHMITFEMEPWVHYVPLEEDPADVLVKLDWVLAHESEARAIVDRAHDHLRWLSGPECLWACNQVVKRIAAPVHTPCPQDWRLRRTPVAFYGHFSGVAFRLGASLVIDQLNRHGIDAHSGEQLPIDRVENSTVVIVQRALLDNGRREVHMGHDLRELLLELKARNNIIIYDVQDLFHFADVDHPARDLVDQIIFPTRALAERFLANGGTTARYEVINLYCDPRVLNHPSPARGMDEMRAVYYGRPNVAPEYHSGRYEILAPHTIGVSDAHLDHLKSFNLHIDINDDWATREYKTQVKIFTAAGCGANVITERNQRTLEVLPDDYPFLIEQPGQLADMLQFAERAYGGPLWHKGLEQMQQVRRSYTLERYMSKFIPLIESL